MSICGILVREKLEIAKKGMSVLSGREHTASRTHKTLTQHKCPPTARGRSTHPGQHLGLLIASPLEGPRRPDSASCASEVLLVLRQMILTVPKTATATAHGVVLQTLWDRWAEEVVQDVEKVQVVQGRKGRVGTRSLVWMVHISTVNLVEWSRVV